MMMTMMMMTMMSKLNFKVNQFRYLPKMDLLGTCHSTVFMPRGFPNSETSLYIYAIRTMYCVSVSWGVHDVG